MSQEIVTRFVQVSFHASKPGFSMNGLLFDVFVEGKEVCFTIDFPSRYKIGYNPELWLGKNSSYEDSLGG